MKMKNKILQNILPDIFNSLSIIDTDFQDLIEYTINQEYENSYLTRIGITNIPISDIKYHFNNSLRYNVRYEKFMRNFCGIEFSDIKDQAQFINMFKHNIALQIMMTILIYENSSSKLVLNTAKNIKSTYNTVWLNK